MSWQARALENSDSMQRTHARMVGNLTRIVAAARSLFQERGGRDFTIQELAERAGVALQTFYRYFPSKDELLLAVFEEIVGEGTARVRSAALDIEGPLERLRVVVEGSILASAPGDDWVSAVVLVREHLRLAELFPKEVESAQRPYVDLLRGLIDEAVADGAIPPRADVDQDARLIMYVVRSVYQVLVTSTATTPPEALAGHAWRFCLGGLQLPQPATGAKGARPANRGPGPRATTR
jgi:AcrR family transcriptional regulator